MSEMRKVGILGVDKTLWQCKKCKRIEITDQTVDEEPPKCRCGGGVS